MIAVKLGFLESDFWNNSLLFSNIIEQAHNIPGYIKPLPLIAGILGISLAYLFYVRLPGIAQVLSHSFYGLYLVLKNKYYIDEIYNILFVKTYSMIANLLWQIADIKIIDRFGPNGSAFVSQRLSGIVAQIQSGYIYNYIFVMILCLIGLLSWYIIII